MHLRMAGNAQAAGRNRLRRNRRDAETQDHGQRNARRGQMYVQPAHAGLLLAILIEALLSG